MKIVKQSYEIESDLNEALIVAIEKYGRTCYKSEDRTIDVETAKKFVAMLIERGHHSVLEHGAITVRFVCDRGVSHEIVRHRLASYSQESTRYCNYAKDKFGNEITVIDLRPFMTKEQAKSWMGACEWAEGAYFKMVAEGAKPQIARSVLPNSLKTEIVMSANPREWRHFFKMRAAAPAHPQMRELACPLLKEFRERVPVLFDDVGDPDCDPDCAGG
jgi:thymidylate synthase (FAD)